LKVGGKGADEANAFEGFAIGKVFAEDDGDLIEAGGLRIGQSAKLYDMGLLMSFGVVKDHNFTRKALLA
jgi:hypothetical protein